MLSPTNPETLLILFPAIDLKDGQCVRLRHGEMSRATVFNDNPAAQARAFEEQGFGYLHIVDLNGAFAGKLSTATRSMRSWKQSPFRRSSAAASAIWLPSRPGSIRASRA